MKHVLVTGDALTYNNCSSDPLIYGLQVLPDNGGTTANSFLIDSDHDTSSLGKFRQGDVEISCPAPLCPRPPGDDVCDSLQQAEGCVSGGPDDFCRPTELVLDPVSGLITLTECGCVNSKECYIEFYYQGNQPVVVCQGLHCPGTNRPCELTATDNNDGTFTYSCCQCEKHAPVSIDLTTGVTNTNPPDFIAPGGDDDTWTVTNEPPPLGTLPRAAVVVDPTLQPQQWLTIQNPPSQWISAGSGYEVDAPPEYYCYESCFCLNDGFQNASLSFSLRADNSAEVFLNNDRCKDQTATPLVSTPLNLSYNTSNPTTYPPGNPALFVPGNNCIQVRVHNDPVVGPNPTGFNLTGLFMADNAQCCCQPTFDGFGCQNTICPDSDETCEPTQMVFDQSTGQTTITKCDCVNANLCYIVRVDADDPLRCHQGVCPFAGGDCPLGPTETVVDGRTIYECCPKEPPDLCPLPTAAPDDPCIQFQSTECDDPAPNEFCLPKCVDVMKPAMGSPDVQANSCHCADDYITCGSIEFRPIPPAPATPTDFELFCIGDCLGVDRCCRVEINGAVQAFSSVFVSNPIIDDGDKVCCTCANCPPCDDELFCNGVETSNPNGDCIAGDPPCAVEFLCDEEQDTCLVAIPTVSQWGLLVMTLLLLIGAKIYFARRETATA